jgi:hypothetical protein
MRNAKRVVPITIFIYLVLFGFIPVIIKSLGEYSTNLFVQWIVILSVSSINLLIAVLSAERILNKISNITIDKQYKGFLGEWSIEIEYENAQGDRFLRHGSFKIKNSLEGLKIDGGPLFEKNLVNHNPVEDGINATESRTVNNWESDFLEIIEEDGVNIIFYVYGIHRNNNLIGDKGKVGTVLAVNKKETRQRITFSGEFMDVKKTLSSEELYKGKVKLVKPVL